MESEGTNRKTAESAYFKQMCDTSGIALLAVDLDQKIIYCNQKAAELFDSPADQIVRSPIDCVFGQESAKVVSLLVEGALQKGEFGESELTDLGTRGTERILAINVSPIQDGEGHALGASACIREITDPILLQERLGESRKMRALGALAGNLAHHFNNILGSVVTSVDFAKESSDVRVMRKALQGTARALQRATGLLDGLLAFAEADYRDADLSDLTETVLHFVENIRSQLDERNITLELRLSQIPVIEVPKNQFLTILGNITGNAIDAMPYSGRLQIELHQSEDHVVCRISDSGRGIVREELEHVFEPFYSTKDQEQVENDQSRHPGLGLSVAMGMVHELGGDIAITSTPGVQTQVEIRLPLDSSSPVPQRSSGQSQASRSPSARQSARP